jgi:O-antigen/teichoic acid export membrane protein
MSSPTEPSTLRSRIFRAGAWTMGGHLVAQVIRLGSTLVMTRLLAPEMFGVMAIATMVTVVLTLLSDIGLHQNIVQSKRGDDPVFLDTAWVVQIYRGFGLWLIALLLSGALYVANHHGVLPAGSVYASPELPLIIAVSSFSAVILGFQSTRIGTALRRVDQKRTIQIELLSQISGLCIMLTIGLITHSIWALVAGALTANLVSTMLSHIWMQGYPNRFRWDRQSYKELLEFGKWVFFSSAAYVFASKCDRLLLGVFVNAETLGFYAIASLMIGAIETGFNRIFSRVSMPVLSEITRHQPARLPEMYYKMRLPGDLLLLFMAGLLFATAQLVVDLLYDARYAEVGGMLQILAVSLFVLRYGVSNQIYLAMGIPRYLSILNIVRFLSLFILVPVLYHFAGIPGAIWGVALHALVTVPLVYIFNARLNLNNFRKELLVLPALPAGYFCGQLLVMLTS